MSKSKDFYQTLEVTKSATAEEIKKNYKKLAKKYHPDIHPDDKEAEIKFKELSEAYAVLSDTEKRKDYNSIGHEAFTSSGQGNNFRNMNSENMGSYRFGGNTSFEDIFGDSFGGGGRRRTRKKRPPANQKGEDKLYAVTVDLDDAITGSIIELSITRREKCKQCSGATGTKGKCPDCNGTGEDQTQQSYYQEPCYNCDGTGEAIVEPCKVCGATGLTPIFEKIKVTVPKGIRDGGKIRISGKGDDGRGTGKSGDLYIEINITEHPVYTRDGDNLYLNLDVDIFEALLGAKITVPTPYGEVALNIPKGSDNDQKFRLKSRGMPKMKSVEFGDLYVVIHVKTPKIEDQAILDDIQKVMDRTKRLDRSSILDEGTIKRSEV